MAEPLSREERARVMGFADTEWVCVPVDAIERYEATVQRAEAVLQEVEDYLLWRPCEKGHAAAHRRLAERVRAYREEAG